MNIFWGGWGYDETVEIFTGPLQKWATLGVISKHSRAST